MSSTCINGNCGYNAAMLLPLLYLAVNLACLLTVLALQYWKLWPAWVLMQAAVTWQAFIRLYVPTDDRAAWMRLWHPGEVVLLTACALAILESLWRSLKDWHWRPLIVAGAATMATWIAWNATQREVYEDWYDRFLGRREGLNLDFALLSVCAALLFLFFIRRSPRVDRMHPWLLASVMVGHVVMADWASWQGSNRQYRWFEMLTCVGWIVNAGFLAVEIAAASRKARQSALPSLAASAYSRHVFPPPVPEGLARPR